MQHKTIVANESENKTKGKKQRKEKEIKGFKIKILRGSNATPWSKQVTNHLYINWCI